MKGGRGEGEEWLKQVSSCRRIKQNEGKKNQSSKEAETDTDGWRETHFLFGAPTGSVCCSTDKTLECTHTHRTASRSTTTIILHCEYYES